ncbi:cytochrome P450 4C1-like isoform X2 [Maniola jurtina]|uniref:cytochrome P450 4C1-like isoform X2 n=1 Tax=Maniola jurtina TaxID=191418 RepID=UPI001E68A12C|nr:cytochrome P450 4C1-like isoform X2 [Maniola jurtina]
MLTAVLVLLVLVLVLKLLTLASFRRNSGKDEPPVLPGAVPLIGHAYLLIGDSLKLWKVAKKLCYDSLNAGGVISVYIGPRTVYLVTDPDDCLKIANTCLQKDNFYKFIKPWLGEALLTAELPIWKVHRKLLNPAFNQSILNGFIDIFNRQARRLVKNLEVEVDKGTFDQLAYTLPSALETSCLTVMAVDFSDETLLNSEYVHAIENIFKCVTERFQKPWLHSEVLYNWTSLKRRQDECLKILHNMSNTVLKKRKSEYLNDKRYKEMEDTAKGKNTTLDGSSP